MRTWRVLAIGSVAVMLLVGSAMAQGRRGFGFQRGPMEVVAIPEVQAELKLDQTQKELIAALTERYRQEARSLFQSLRDLSEEDRRTRIRELTTKYDRELTGVLKPEQKKRLNQIVWQARGPSVVLEEAVGSQLNLTADQRNRIQAIVEQMAQARRQAFQNAQGDFQGVQQQLQQLRQQEEQQINAVLTETQRTKLREILGPPFQLPPPRRGNN